jgi:hypothetical protein
MKESNASMERQPECVPDGASCVPASVHVEHRAGDVRRIRPGQEGDRTRNFFRPAKGPSAVRPFMYAACSPVSGFISVL